MVRMKIAAFMAIWVFFMQHSLKATDSFKLEWGTQYGTTQNDGNRDIHVNPLGKLDTMWFRDTYASTEPTTIVRDTWDTSGNISQRFEEPKGWWEYPTKYEMDNQGNTYIFGYCRGPSGGEYQGWVDGFVRKYDSNGTLQWGRQVGTSGYDAVLTGHVDAQGSVYLCGHSTDMVVPGGSGDSFFVKYDGNGSEQWRRQYSTGMQNGHAHSLLTDESGNLYVSGHTWNNTSNTYGLLMKLSAENGDLAWEKTVDLLGDAGGFNLTDIDSEGNIVFTGETRGALAGSYYGGQDICLGKFNSFGQVTWIGQYGSAGDDFQGTSIIDEQNHVTLSGSTNGNFLGQNQGGTDGFIAQFDQSGTILAGSLLGYTGLDHFGGLCSDGTYYYVTGSTNGSLWGPNLGGYDCLIAKMSIVPEPVTMGLLLLGGLAVLRRKK